MVPGIWKDRVWGSGGFRRVEDVERSRFWMGASHARFAIIAGTLQEYLAHKKTPTPLRTP